MHPRQLLNHSFYDVLCNCRAVDQSLNPVKTTLPIKEDDDAHSIASYVLYPRTLFLLLLIYLLPVSELSILFYSHFHLLTLPCILYFIRSTTPSGRRSSGSFAFRLDERAEKRKEVANTYL